jgi:hypothetical protein
VTLPFATNRYGDLLKELYQGIKNNNLSDVRMDEIVRVFNEFSDRENKTSSWLRLQDNRIGTDFLDLPINVIYSTVLENNKASILIDPLTTDYRSLIIIGSGCINQASGGNIWCQFNGDTVVTDYAYQLISGAGAVVGGLEDTTFHGCALGVFGTTGAGAGVNGSFRAEIPHYTSSVWKKNVLAQTFTAEFNDLYLVGSFWAGTSPITSIEIFGTDNTLAKGTASILAGSLITVLGVK